MTCRLWLALPALLVTAPLAAQNAPPIPVWHLVQEWRVGGEPDGPHSFDLNAGLAVLPNGGLVHLGGQSQRLFFLSPKGEPVKAVGQRGSGPGDLNEPNGFAVTKGGEVVVNDRANARFSRFTPAGVFRAITRIEQPRSTLGKTWDAHFLNDGRLIERVGLLATPGRAFETVLWSADLTKPAVIRSKACDAAESGDFARAFYPVIQRSGKLIYNRPIPYAAPIIPVAFDPAGYIWEQRGIDSNEIVKRPIGGCTIVATIKLSGPRSAVTAPSLKTELEREQAWVTKMNAVLPENFALAPTHPWFDMVHIDTTGNLWVERVISGQRSVEIFDRNGKPLAKLDTPLPVLGTAALVITTGHVYGFQADDDGVGYLVALKIVR